MCGRPSMRSRHLWSKVVSVSVRTLFRAVSVSDSFHQRHCSMNLNVECDPAQL
jgi:hypothetical protein